MEAVNLRPRLVSFRATSFHGDNKDVSEAGRKWSFRLTQTIEVSLLVPDVPSFSLLAIVRVELLAKARAEGEPEQTADFSGGYEAKFAYPPGVTEREIAPLFEQEPYQYVLVAQAFPLAMTHFRREMQAMGFDARKMPLGI